MSEVRVTRAEKLLSKLVGERKITKSGADWLVAALDPFHDTQLKDLQGWPDVESGPSVVRCIKQSYQISRPASIVGNWDCHVMMLPWHIPINLTASDTRRNNAVSKADWTTVTVAQIGGIRAQATAAGVDLNLGTSPVLAQSVLDNTFTDGAGRLVGVGFEITNTTSALNRQGTCYVYREMNAAEEPATFNYYGPIGSSQTLTPIRDPPRNAADLMMIPGSRQWAAEEGCYVVGSFHSVENKPIIASYTAPVFDAGGNNDEAEGALNTFNVLVPTLQVGASTAYITPMKMDNTHIGGALFAGLSSDTTLTLNTIHYYECFPGVSQQEILVLATPSAEFDADALNLYSHAMSSMPVGVKVGENGLGDWFSGIIGKVASFLGPALSVVPHPAAQAGSVLANALSNNSGKNTYLTAPNAKVPRKKPVVKALPGAPRGTPNNSRGSTPIKPNPSPAQCKRLKKFTTAQLKANGYSAKQIKMIHSC